eukprot:2460155-Pleurochrysis_carterae.AAC.3
MQRRQAAGPRGDLCLQLQRPATEAEGVALLLLSRKRTSLAATEKSGATRGTSSVHVQGKAVVAASLVRRRHATAQPGSASHDIQLDDQRTNIRLSRQLRMCTCTRYVPVDLRRVGSAVRGLPGHAALIHHIRVTYFAVKGATSCSISRKQTAAAMVAGQVNESGVNVDLYIPRKWYARDTSS